MVWGKVYRITKKFLKDMKHEFYSPYGATEYFGNLSNSELSALKGGARKTKHRKKMKQRHSRKRRKTRKKQRL